MKINEMNIVITGANGAVASNLISFFLEKAASVTGTVRKIDRNIEDTSNNIIEMDPLNNYSIEKGIDCINNKVGIIHCWFNIVGGFSMGRRVETGLEEWSYMYNTNFMTALNCCQQILSKMKENNWGRIINMGAQVAIKGMALTGPYCSSKTSVHMLTKIIALENGNEITCNAILPGIISTPKNQKEMPSVDQKDWTSIESIALKIEDLLLSKENGQLIHL
tara:strand:- start:2741 stop:3403 length:663 start_codon:yes stop_codon:yes gene_type:complete